MDSDDAPPTEMPDFPTDELALDKDTAERLLDGRVAPADAPPGYAVVARVLGAAAGPARPEELAGQAAAVAMFRAARPRLPDRSRRAGREPAGRRRAGRFRSRLMVVAAAGSLLVGGAAAAGGLPPLQRAIRAVQPGGGDAAPAGRSTARPLLPPPATAPDRTASGGPAGAMTRSGTPCPNGGAKLGHGRASTGQPATTRQPSGGSSCRPGLSDPDPGKSKPKGPEDKGRGGGNGGKHRPRPPKDGRKAAPQTGVSDAQREPDSR